MKTFFVLAALLSAGESFASGTVNCEVTGGVLDTRITWDTKSIPLSCPRASGRPITGVVSRGTRAQAVTVRVQPSGNLVTIPLQCGSRAGCNLDTIGYGQLGDSFTAYLRRSNPGYTGYTVKSVRISDQTAIFDSNTADARTTVTGRVIDFNDGIPLLHVNRMNIEPVNVASSGPQAAVQPPAAPAAQAKSIVAGAVNSAPPARTMPYGVQCVYVNADGNEQNALPTTLRQRQQDGSACRSAPVCAGIVKCQVLVMPDGSQETGEIRGTVSCMGRMNGECPTADECSASEDVANFTPTEVISAVP